MSEFDSAGLVTIDIKVEGKRIADTIPVHALQIERTINRISSATITVLDGNPSTGTFAVSASDTFVPGNVISIEAGYDGSNKNIFEGIVTKQALRINNDTGSLLEIECKDKAIKMTVGRKSSTFSKIKDSDVITILISNAGLASEVTSTPNELSELVQYNCSDWDFLISRAEVNSMVVSTINGEVLVFNPAKDTSSIFTLTYGDNLYSLNADLNSVSQLAHVKASAWDYKNQKMINAQESNNLSGPGNLSSKKLSEVVGLAEYELQTAAAINQDELTSWAKAQMLKSELSKITGDARFQGNAVVKPGDYLTLDGLGSRFNGDHFVSSVRHHISEGNWFTDVNIGLSSVYYVQENRVEAPPAAGLLPSIQGLFNGTVKKIDDDPDSEYRILVEVALFNDKSEGLWARLSSVILKNERSIFYLPGIGDEVILGFLNQDPRYPVILGSLNSQATY